VKREDVVGELRNPDERLTVGLVGSSGGHLAHLLLLEPWWKNHDRFWVTFDMPDSHDLLDSERVEWAHYPTTRNVPNFTWRGRSSGVSDPTCSSRPAQRWRFRSS